MSSYHGGPTADDFELRGASGWPCRGLLSRDIAHATPTAWAMDGLGDLILRDRGLAEVAPILGVLLAYGAACFGLGARLYRLPE